MICANLRKIWSNPRILLLMVLLLMLNTTSLIYQATVKGESGFSAQDVAQVYTQTTENQAKTISQKLEVLAAQWNTLLDEATRSGVFNTTEEELEKLQSDIALYTYIQEEVAQAENYGVYLASIEAESQRMEGSSLLFQGNSFSARNILALAKQYAKLEQQSLSWTPSQGIALITNQPLTDCSILLCVVIWVLTLTVSEREKGYHTLYKSVYHGCGRTWISNVLTLLCLTFVVTIVFYGTATLVAITFVGLGNFSAPIQTMSIYYNCPYDFTIGSFILVFLGAKLVAMVCTTMILFCWCCYCSTSLRAIAGIVLGGLLSGMLRISINPHNWFGFLTEWNVLSVLDIHHYAQTAQMVNIVGFPVTSYRIGVLFVILSLSFSIPLSHWLWNRPSTVMKQRSFSKIPLFQTDWMSIWMHEVRKLLMTNHGLIIFCSMAIVLPMLISSPTHVTETEFYYRQYAAKLTGEVSTEGSDFLQAERLRINTAEETRSQLTHQYSTGKISEETYQMLMKEWEVPSAQKIAFAQVELQYATLLARQESGLRVVFGDETGWQRLQGDWGKKQLFSAGAWTALLMTLWLYQFWSMEEMSGMTSLIRCSPTGIHGVAKGKRKAAFALGLLAAPTPFLWILCSVHKVFPLGNWNSLLLSANSILALGNMPNWCSLGIYFLLRIGSIWAEVILCARMTLLIGKKLRHSLTSLLLLTMLYGTAMVIAWLFEITPILSGRTTIPGMIGMILLGIYSTIQQMISNRICSMTL